MDVFLAKMADILEEDAVQADQALDDFSTWDSLGVLSAIAMIDEVYGVTVNAEDLKGKSVGALFDLVQSRRS